MRPNGVRRCLPILIVAAAGSLGAAPAAKTYLPIEQHITALENQWSQPGAKRPRTAEGWIAYFDALRKDLDGYASGTNETERLQALGRLYQFSVALQSVNWKPAQEIRTELRTWLRPRIQLAWARRRLVDTVQHLPTASEAQAQANRQRWIDFVGNDLGQALREYDAAATVAARQAALKRVYGALNELHSGNEKNPWAPAGALENALNDLFNVKNLNLTADVPSLAPALNQNVVQAGPIFFKGQWSYVTPGPKTGFGLLQSEEGIAFYNSQMMTSVTPIRGFNEQMQQDPRGQRATKLYHFDATSQDNSQLTIQAVVKTDGLHLWPAYVHNVSAAINSMPTAGHGLGRFIAAMVGFNQNKITQKVWEGAIGQIAQGVESGAMELGTIRTGEAAAEQNVKIRQYLVGNDTLAYKNLTVTGLRLRSRPDYALIDGTIRWQGAGLQLGATAPEPSAYKVYQAGVSIDVHLPSVMSNLTRGYLQSPAATRVQNLMVVTHKIPPGAPPEKGVDVSQNVDYPTFLHAIQTAQAAKDPKEMAIRVKRPGQAPEFSVDSRGYLVALVHDFALEVPAPPQAAKGGPLLGPAAKVYMLTAPQAEFVISFKIEPGKVKDKIPVHLKGRIEAFDPGYGSRVYAINDDEAKPQRLTGFASAGIFTGFGVKVQGQPVDIPLSQIKLKGFELTSASPLDPSGWLRLIMTPTGEPVGVDAPAQVAGGERPSAPGR